MMQKIGVAVASIVAVRANEDPLGGLGGLGGMPGMEGLGGMPGMDGMGGMGGMPGMEGLANMFKTERNCPTFKCKSKDTVFIQKSRVDEDARIYSHGCGDNAFDFMNKNKEPGQVSPVEVCCENRTICLQTCGMTKGQCEYEFEKCKKKQCKGDQSCIMSVDLQISMAEMGLGMPSGSGNPKCAEYEKWQADRCDCVDKSSFEDEFKKRMEEIYSEVGHEKFNGEADDEFMRTVVYKAFPKAEADLAKFAPRIFKTLHQKYSDKLVEKKEREKPDFLKDLPKDLGAGAELEDKEGEDEDDKAEEADDKTEEDAPKAQKEEL